MTGVFYEIKRREVVLDPQLTERAQERSRGREVEAGIRKLDYLLLQLLFKSCATDIIVIVTMLHTAVEIAISGAHKLLRTGEVPTAFNIIVVLAAVHGLLGLLRMGVRGRAEPLTLFPSDPSHPLFPMPNKPPRFRGRKATCLLCPLPILLTVGNGLIQTMLIKASQ